MSLIPRILQLLSAAVFLIGCSTSVSQQESAQATIPVQVIDTPATPVVRADERTIPDTGFMARADVQSFHHDLVTQRHLPAQPVAQLLSQAQYQETARRLMTPRAPGQPPIVRDWPTYRGRFVEPIRIEAGRKFMAQHHDVLEQAQQRYGVSASIIAAIIGVETLYGQHMGNFRVLDTITTLAFDYPDHPKRTERVDLFRGQLADLIELHLAGKLDAYTQLGSFAGAIGIPQFMPTSIKSYAVSAHPPRPIALETQVDDAIFSVASFLRAHGWVPGAPVFAPVALPANAGNLVTGGLTPTLTWAQLQASGAHLRPGQTSSSWQDLPLGVIDLPTARTGHSQYLVATPNFFALTHYNRSYFYATAVTQLASAIADQTGSKRPVDR